MTLSNKIIYKCNVQNVFVLCFVLEYLLKKCCCTLYIPHRDFLDLLQHKRHHNTHILTTNRHRYRPIHHNGLELFDVYLCNWKRLSSITLPLSFTQYWYVVVAAACSLTNTNIWTEYSSVMLFKYIYVYMMIQNQLGPKTKKKMNKIGMFGLRLHIFILPKMAFRQIYMCIHMHIYCMLS